MTLTRLNDNDGGQPLLFVYDFRIATKNFAPSCFRSASGRYRNAKNAPKGALQATDNTWYFGCGSWI